MSIAVTVSRDPTIDLGGKILQVLGLDAGYQLTFFWRQRKGLTQISCRNGLSWVV
jgi:hypothetical protein